MRMLRNQAVRNTNVLKPGMFRIASTTAQNRTPQLPHASRNTNPHMSKSSGVIHTTSVSRPQLKSYQVKDKVVPNISHVKFTKKEVEDHPRISSISKKTKSVTACNDSSNSRTSNVNAVCAECGKCVFNSNHDACVSRYLKDVNARTKKPQVVPISASKPKRKANKSVATPHKKTVASDTTIQKSKSYYKKLYEDTNQEWKWWIAKRCPSGYTWTQKPLRTKKIWMPKIRKDDVSSNISPTIDIIVQLILFIVDSGCTKHMTGNLKLLCNFVEKFLGTVRFGNDQFAPILGYGDLIQGNVTIKRVYYVEGLNHNLFSVGQFCDADLERHLQSVITVRTDRGTEFLKRHISAYFKEEALTSTSTPETLNRTALSKDETYLINHHIHLWKDGIQSSNDRKPSIKHLHIFGCICYITRDGENLDKMKEKGDPCVMVGYSTQSKGYRVYNKRTRLIAESIHIKFDEIKEMMSDHNSSDLAPQRQEMSVKNVSSGLVPQGKKASDYDNFGPVPPRQNVVPPAEKIDSSQQGLECLFSPLLEEYYNPTQQ
ncbi:retrovirus-related pol polyprotein from transposon TNT 1-94 [Tanacetum coccineum]